MNRQRYAAVILAAGKSSRMEQFKPLLPLGEATLADHVISTFISCEVTVLLVVGYQQDKLRAGIKKWDISIVENPDYARGMLSSVQAGVRCLTAGYRAFFVMPVDIPLVSPSTIKQLLDAAQKHPGDIIYPVFNKKRGHPPLIPSELIPDILEWQQGGGLKSILDSRSELAREVPVADGNILFDVDTPEDYRTLLERYNKNG